ncbi:uncharacterized protein LOC106476023 isoform X2 [Limulus polyphemus]|uniref:Uncharacterized protein LOC106476023 isoform X2 n=1 Tax=Limulus polyphemus TaxID=6850 RepID=A0ABM1RWG0_LIMPO|nr:uncharacterized protein LOC106476023 isoform X2 [Limulus polyphemus]
MVTHIDARLRLYYRESSENGIDNPFRPEGDLSKEAESIVCLIKEGKPITPNKEKQEDCRIEDSLQTPNMDELDTPKQEQVVANNVTSAKPDVNGAPLKTTSSAVPAVVEVQHGIIAPSDSSQVEPVVIKKKPKCRCCVLQ